MKPSTSLPSAVIFGAGNIGRGFIGQLLCESGFQVVFVDVDPELTATLNRRGGYALRTVAPDGTEADAFIAPASVLDARGNPEAIAKAIETADFAATAVGAAVLPRLVPNLAAGLRRRRAALRAKPLDILLCENLKGAAAYFKSLVAAELGTDDALWLEDQVGFVDTVIGRMVPPPTPEMRAADPGFILVEPYRELPVDARGFRGEPPRVAGMTAHADFAPYTARKLYLHNCGHAMLAYFGHRRGHRLGVEALRDTEVTRPLRAGLAESAAGIAAQYGVERAWLDTHVAELLARFDNPALGDTIFRLGRDPLRKLAPSDRLVGAARVASKVAVPVHLAAGIAAALRFDHPDDPVAVSLQKRIADEGVERIVSEVCSIDPAEPLGRRVLDAWNLS